MWRKPANFYELYTWHIFIQILNIASFWTVTYSSSDWREVERLAEDHPYLVAVLDDRKEYVCTGFSINEYTVLTTGSCVATPPSFVAITAVLGDDFDGKNLLRVSHAKIHSSFACYVSQTQPSETIMNSNIALVYVVHNKLEFFANAAVLGDFGPTDLRKKKLTAVGHGELEVGTIVLQRQVYVQKTCVNPQWYFCVCGVESTSESTYDYQFGEGGPVMLDKKVVAVTAAPCGALVIPNTDVKYNIFTVVMQYNSWIRNNLENASLIRQKLESIASMSNNGTNLAESFVIYMITLLIIYNLIN